MKLTAMPALCLICWHTPGWADAPDPYYVEPALAPYPPGCVTLPARQVELYGDNAALFWTGSLPLELVNKRAGGPDFGLVEASMYRVACAEPGRSAIMMEFRLPGEWADPLESRFILPSFTAEGPGGFHYVPFELKAEPNGWGQSPEQQSLTRHSLGDYTGGWDNPRLFTWRYILDMAPLGAGWQLMADAYNEAFVLLGYSMGALHGPFIEVPATRSVIEPNPTLPLNGRLTGVWVEPGSTDQGLLLSFGSPVPAAGSKDPSPQRPELGLFLSWFTFDAEGRQLWLAGDARFPQGASEVWLPLIRVAEGQFLGPPAAPGLGVDPRTLAGEIHIKARSCNALEVDYDLSSLALGAGSFRLQRLDALETAGYPCRDYEARLASRSPDAAR